MYGRNVHYVPYPLIYYNAVENKLSVLGSHHPLGLALGNMPTCHSPAHAPTVFTISKAA